MKKLFIVLFVLLAIISCSNKKQAIENKEILVLAAASLTDVMKELSRIYEESNNIKINFSFASSGILQNQIEAGAPADIFFSAAQKQMNSLEEKNLIDKKTKKTLLENKLVLISPKMSTMKNFYDITNESVKKIGMGDPKIVPAGEYAKEMLENLQLLDKIEPKTIYGSDVRAVLTWTENNDVDLSFVYETDAKIAKNINIIGEAPKGSHKLITYPIAVIESSENKKEALDFIDFLTTKKSLDIFKKYGFSAFIN